MACAAELGAVEGSVAPVEAVPDAGVALAAGALADGALELVPSPVPEDDPSEWS